MKKKKLLSYILSTSLVISLTANPILSMAEETGLNSEITAVQENEDPDQDHNAKDAVSKENTESKDQNGNDRSDGYDKTDQPAGGETEDLQETEDKSDLPFGKDEKSDLNEVEDDHSEDSKKDQENDSEEGEDPVDSDYEKTEEDETIDPDFSLSEEEEEVDPDFSQPEEKPQESSSAAGATTNGGTNSGSSVASKKNEVDLDECDHLEGCVDGKHDPDCPLYDGEVKLPTEAECAHLEGCVGDVHDKNCPLYEETLLALLSAKDTGIYLDSSDGDDANDGLTSQTAVKTFEQAKMLMEEADADDLYLQSQYEIVGNEEWDLDGKTIHRYGIGGYMIVLADKDASLELEDVIIDGAESKEDVTYGPYTNSIICAMNGGTIVLNSGAVLQNNEAEQWGSAIMALNETSVTMEDGAEILNNHNHNYECGTVLIGNGSTFTMNGGLISENSSNSGGAVAIIGSSMVMNGGTISDNETYRTSGQGSYGGAIYIADYANASGVGVNHANLFTGMPASFEMNGGIISDNTAKDYGGAITTFPQKGKEVKVTINDGEISNNHVPEGSGGAIAAFFAQTKLEINGGSLTENDASDYGGGILLNTISDAKFMDGTISGNQAAYGGGIALLSASATQTGGFIKENIASWGGGVFGGNYTMTGGIITDNNASLSENERASTRGDGVCVGPSFNLGEDAIISTNNDVYLRKGRTVSKEGCYINMISPYTGASTDQPIQVTSQDCTVENTTIGTQLVYYTDAAGGVAAAQQAEEDRIFVPSWKMQDGLMIGQSHAASKTDWLTYIPGIKIQYQWVSTDNPSDVTEPVNDYARPHTQYTAKEQMETDQAYSFEGWFTDAQCTQKYIDGTTLDANTTLYGQWKPAVIISPMDITVYVGGNGYSGVIGDDGFFSSNDLPEIGFYLTLPEDINDLLGSSEEKPVDLSSKFSLTYDDMDDAGHTTRDWELKLYGDESMSHVTMNGQRVFIYKLMPSKIDGTEEKIPLRMQFTDEDGNVITDSQFPVSTGDQYRNYTIHFYPGELNAKEFRATFHVNGTTISRKIHLGNGILRVRGNMDESYRDIFNSTPSVNPQHPGLFLAETAQRDTDYYLNHTGISVPASSVKLLVDHSLDDTLLKKYIESTSNAEGKYSYQFRYLDLVDTNNGNAYVTMGSGQQMKIYWPVPTDAKADTEFHIIHFVGLDRDADVDMSDLWTTHIPEEIFGNKVTIDGHQFVEFYVSSFSPFALLYEKNTTSDPVPSPIPTPSPDHSTSSSHGASSGHGSSNSSGKKSAFIVAAETDKQETKTPDQTDIVPEEITENVLKEENTETALPKTGQIPNPSIFVFFSSALLLLVTLLLKKKEH